jgi:hypothetical protein
MIGDLPARALGGGPHLKLTHYLTGRAVNESASTPNPNSQSLGGRFGDEPPAFHSEGRLRETARSGDDIAAVLALDESVRPGDIPLRLLEAAEALTDDGPTAEELLLKWERSKTLSRGGRRLSSRAAVGGVRLNGPTPMIARAPRS